MTNSVSKTRWVINNWSASSDISICQYLLSSICSLHKTDGRTDRRWIGQYKVLANSKYSKSAKRIVILFHCQIFWELNIIPFHCILFFKYDFKVFMSLLKETNPHITFLKKKHMKLLISISNFSTFIKNHNSC